MSTELRLGGKVRSLRRREKLSQVQLAERLGISPSYLNLIEHNQRTLTAPLLLKLAHQLKVDLQSFAADSEGRLAGDLSEVFGDPLFEEHDLTTSDVRDLATNPAPARAVIRLYHAYRQSLEANRALAARLTDGNDLLGADPAHLPSEEVSDVIQQNMNHFPELEEAAEELTREARLDREDLYAGMCRHLGGLGVEVAITTLQSDPAVVRRFDPGRRRLALSEVLPPRSRNFQVAHQLGLLTLQPIFERIIARSHLTTPESVALCRVALANYFAGALLMPYAAFWEAAESLRYDVELLGHRFRTSFEQVCHRLTTLQRPGMEGVPWHLIRVDIAGNISKKFSASGIRFARFSGSCPRWNVHAAFMTPGRTSSQLSQMPDGTLFFCIARMMRKGRGGHGAQETLLAIGMGCELKHARRLVYADGIDLANVEAAVPIGVTCRLCPRMDCEQRAFPAMQSRLSIDENVRAVSFYASGRTEP